MLCARHHFNTIYTKMMSDKQTLPIIKVMTLGHTY